MPPKRANPIEHPPPASSSEDEDDTTSGSGEEDESSSDEEQTQAPSPPLKTQTLTQKSPAAKPQSQPSNTNNPTQNNGSDSESEDESESGSGSEDESEKEEEQHPQPAAPAPKKATTSKKRGPSNEPYGTPIASKSVTDNGGVGGSVGEKSEDGKKLFQRIWSDDDEVAVLEGMIEYKTKKGKDHVADINAFRDFIKGRLHFDFSLSQLKEKITRMRKKFQNQYNKDENKTFPDAQSQKQFDLSRRIWGRTSNGAGTPNGKAEKGNAKAEKGNAKAEKGNAKAEKGNAKAEKSTAGGGRGKKKVEEVKTDAGVVMENSNGGDKMDIDVERPSGSKKRVKFDGSFYGVANMEEFVMKKGLDFLGDEKRAEMEEKWKKLQLEELKLYARKHMLLKEQTDMIMAAMQD